MLARTQQRNLARQQATAVAAAQVRNNLPVGAALALQARVGQGDFTPVNTAQLLYVPLGTQVEFKAAATGTADQINFTTAAWSGTAGANGAGATKTVTFNAQSASKLAAAAKTVVIAFSGQTVTLRCIVYSLTAVVTPVDNFAGRSLTNVGIDERVNLGFQTTPAAITAVEAGGLKWSVSNLAASRKLGGVLSKTQQGQAVAEDGLAFYIAPYLTDAKAPPQAQTKSVTLRVSVCNGPIKGAGVDLTLTVHMPSAHMTMQAGSEKHFQNYASAGFLGLIHLFPKNVSFKTLRWREAGGRPEHTGTFSTQAWANNAHKPTTFEGQAASDMEVGAGNSVTGCQIQQIDSVFSGAIAWVPPASANNATEVGKYTWPIYWQYRPEDLKGNEPYIRFQIAHHVATMYQTGRMVMYKGHDPASACGECTGRVDKALGAATATPF